MGATEGILTLQGEFREGRYDRLVTLQDEELLRGVAPPANRAAEVGHQLSRGFLEHPRLRAGLKVIVDEAPNTAMAGDLVHRVLLDDLPQVATFAHPVAFLDNAAVHVDEVEAAVGTNGHVHDAEVRIRRTDELVMAMRVGEARDAILDGDFGATDEAADWLGDEHVTTEVRWVAIGTHDFLSTGSGEVIELLIRQGATSATLVVGEADERPDLHEVVRELALEVVSAVKDRGLEMPEAFLAARITPPDFTLVILRQAPLAATVRDGFLERGLRTIPAETISVVGLVQVIVQGPDQAALLVLKVATLGSARKPELLGIGHPRPLGVTVDEDVLGVGLIDENAVVEREHHARQDELVAVDQVLVEAAVTLSALMAGNDADGVVFILTVDFLHVGAELGDIHPAVAVEGDVHRLADAIALAQDKLKAIALGQLDRREFLLRGQRLHCRLWGEIRDIDGLVSGNRQAEGRQKKEGLIHDKIVGGCLETLALDQRAQDKDVVVRSDEEGLPIFPPSEIGRGLMEKDRAEVLTFGRDDEHAARTGGPKVTALVDLHAIATAGAVGFLEWLRHKDVA